MKPLDFILDTDAGGDCDDMMALAYLVYASRHLKVNIKAVTNGNACPGGPDLIRTFFERIGAPVPMLGGPVGNAQNYDNYATSVINRFSGGEVREYPDAVTVLRRALASVSNIQEFRRFTWSQHNSRLRNRNSGGSGPKGKRLLPDIRIRGIKL